jgi:hypothetical protein
LRKPLFGLVRILAIIITISGCSSLEEPSAPINPTVETLKTTWETLLDETDGWVAGRWHWSWANSDSLFGTAQLVLSPLENPGTGWTIQWNFPSHEFPNLPRNQTLVFTPADSSRWHLFRWSNSSPESLATAPFPLPRQPTQSSQYTGLLDLLQALTTPFFNQVVTHWPNYPVPVRLVEASNGSVNLTECLTEAMEIWNEGEPRPWFESNNEAGWGIRLVHFPNRNLRPPLAAQITRLDSIGNPLRVHLLAGNNYDDAWDRIYAVRGFVHELGHALFFWGHSLDRIHSLWGQAPPLVAAPSLDERKAARWWHGLPVGLDLSRYGPPPAPSELSGRKGAWQPDAHPSGPRQPTGHFGAGHSAEPAPESR